MTDPSTPEHKPVTAAQLRSRRDGDWEGDANEIRAALALDWAEPVVRQLRAMLYLGADVREPEEYNRLVDELYDGLRERTTRQDLLYLAVVGLTARSEELVDSMTDGAMEELEELDDAHGFDRLLRPNSL